MQKLFKTKKIIFSFLFIFGVLVPSVVFGAELLADTHEVFKAEVIEVSDIVRENIAGTKVEAVTQNIVAKIIDSKMNGERIELINDFTPLEKGDIFYLTKTVHAEDGKIMYSVGDRDRTPTLIFFLILFVTLVILFGGIQGVRGLLALIGSLLAIFYIFLPGILLGFSPIILSIVVSSIIIIVGSYVTHGYNRTTTSAVLGMIGTVIITGIMAYFALKFAHLSGFDSEEAVYLNLNTDGAIDFQGLLYGAIMIGLLGVLYDIAIGQAIAVEELIRAGLTDTKKLYVRAIRIGREHIGALVNTLAIAYVGASLPLLLLFYSSATLPFGVIVNREIFATEIIRTLIGSIGIVLAVPITTFFSVFMLRHYANELKNKTVSEHHGHHH